MDAELAATDETGMSQYLKETRRYHLVILFALLSVALWFTPVQHIISIGRFQHYSMAIFVFSCGYFIQSAFSWKELSNWGRLAYLLTGIFFTSVSIVFLQNPWLVDRASVASEDKLQMRTGMMLSYMTVSIVIGIVWLKVAYDEAMEKRNKQRHPDQAN
ncbi:MAG: hypothetical protein C0507_01395 [Cyanobacteria bacterium PR.3.49]|jgi:uncharacterized membrane protein|nr:hypothetical protein [Cyanobacteria bacterium PR.3.49]